MLTDFSIRSSRLADLGHFLKPGLLVVNGDGIWVYIRAHVECDCHLTRCVYNRYPIVKQIAWEEITGVRSTDGLLWTSVTIDTFDGSEYCVQGLWKPDAEKFIHEVTEHLFRLYQNSPRQLETYRQNRDHPGKPLDCCELMDRHPSDVKIVYKKSK